MQSVDYSVSILMNSYLGHRKCVSLQLHDLTEIKANDRFLPSYRLYDIDRDDHVDKITWTDSVRVTRKDASIGLLSEYGQVASDNPARRYLMSVTRRVIARP